MDLYTINAEKYKIDLGKTTQQHLEKHDLSLWQEDSIRNKLFNSASTVLSMKGVKMLSDFQNFVTHSGGMVFHDLAYFKGLIVSIKEQVIFF